MITKDDFKAAQDSLIEKYPELQARYAAGDPELLQGIEAVFSAFSMLSAQIEVAMAEPHEKTRDATVLADAALRGIIPKATPTRVRLLASNKNTTDYEISSGRTLVDSSGNSYRVETMATIPAMGTATVDCIQGWVEEVQHTVTAFKPFYSVEVPTADDGYLASIAVSDSYGDSYDYRLKYTNTEVGEKVFHVEVDHNRVVYVRFGNDGVVGHQPAAGDVITLAISYCIGALTLETGSPFSFEYIELPEDSLIELSMSSQIEAGANPHSIEYIRELCKYPSLYDDDAVFLGEFDFLVRKHFPDLSFLSVWNESVEEDVRGASTDNINAIFVACFDEDEQVLSGSVVSPVKLLSNDLSDTQEAIKSRIQAADDSYRVIFYTPIKSEIPVEVVAYIPSSYVAATVKAQIVERVLASYGIDSTAAKRGRNNPSHREMYKLLEADVSALANSGADFTVAVPYVDVIPPELWRYVSADSLSVTIKTVNSSASAWG
jgi:hypothetical protein